MSADQPLARRDVGALEAAWRQGQVVLLAPPQLASSQAASAHPRPAALQALAASWGPGVVVGSGGSTGGRRWCFQPLTHLEASAAATAVWLRGFENDIYFQIGLVTLIGLSAKNAILIVEFARELEHDGHTPLSAAISRSLAARIAAVSRKSQV